MDDPTRDEWLTVRGVADLFKVDEETVRRWARRGDLSYLDVGGRGGYRFARSEVAAFVGRRRRKQTRRPADDSERGGASGTPRAGESATAKDPHPTTR